MSKLFLVVIFVFVPKFPLCQSFFLLLSLFLFLGFHCVKASCCCYLCFCSWVSIVSMLPFLAVIFVFVPGFPLCQCFRSLLLSLFLFLGFHCVKASSCCYLCFCSWVSIVSMLPFLAVIFVFVPGFPLCQCFRSLLLSLFLFLGFHCVKASSCCYLCFCSWVSTVSKLLLVVIFVFVPGFPLCQYFRFLLLSLFLFLGFHCVNASVSCCYLSFCSWVSIVSMLPFLAVIFVFVPGFPLCQSFFLLLSLFLFLGFHCINASVSCVIFVFVPKFPLYQCFFFLLLSLFLFLSFHCVNASFSCCYLCFFFLGFHCVNAFASCCYLCLCSWVFIVSMLLFLAVIFVFVPKFPLYQCFFFLLLSLFLFLSFHCVNASVPCCYLCFFSLGFHCVNAFASCCYL